MCINPGMTPLNSTFSVTAPTGANGTKPVGGKTKSFVFLIKQKRKQLSGCNTWGVSSQQGVKGSV